MNEIEKAIEELKEQYANDECVIGADTICLAITALEAQKADMWVMVSERLPDCEHGYESKEVLYQLKNTGTIESGYYCSGGKLRDRYFRHLRDSSEGVDISDVVAWKPLPEPWKEEQP